MRFCPWCGCPYPESRRESFFQTPSAEDEADVVRVIRVCNTANELRETIGAPDHIFPGGGGSHIRRQLTYSSRWESIKLYVFEAFDGSLEFVYGGKESGGG